MVFLRQRAIPELSAFCRVDERHVAQIETQLGAGSTKLQSFLDQSFREMDRLHPSLAEFLADSISEVDDEVAQSLGYFLSVAVYLSFREAFPSRIAPIDATAIRITKEMLTTDEELRLQDPQGDLETDDIIAISQPALIRFVQHHFEQAIAQSDTGTLADTGTQSDTGTGAQSDTGAQSEIGSAPSDLQRFQSEVDASLTSFDRVYRTVLVQIVALSTAVSPPSGTVDTSAFA